MRTSEACEAKLTTPSKIVGGSYEGQALVRAHTQKEDYHDENCSDQLNPNECVIHQGDLRLVIVGYQVSIMKRSLQQKLNPSFPLLFRGRFG